MNNPQETRKQAAGRPSDLLIRDLVLQPSDVELFAYKGLRSIRLWKVTTEDTELREKLTRKLCRLKSLISFNFQGDPLGNTSHVMRRLVHYAPILLQEFYLQDVRLTFWQLALAATILKQGRCLETVAFWRIATGNNTLHLVLNSFSHINRFTFESDRPADNGEIWGLAKTISSKDFKCSFTDFQPKQLREPVHWRLLNAVIERHSGKTVRLGRDHLEGNLLAFSTVIDGLFLK